MRVLDLFSGIGGFSLGLERAGMRTVAFCEIDSYCRAVIAKHWPGVPIFWDICELTAETVAYPARQRWEGNASNAGGGSKGTSAQAEQQFEWFGIDLICGGFPCQDISVAGKGAGLAGARSGLWREYLRLIGELRPRYVIVENVSALLSRGLGAVLGGLSEIGYDAEWHCIPASYVGAPHRRDRVWIVAYPQNERRERGGTARSRRNGFKDRSEDMAHAAGGVRQWPAQGEIRHAALSGEIDGGFWRIEPNVGRVAHGVPNRVDRLKGLGNAIVPQIAELIGKAILAHGRPSR